ncbi:Proteasomal ATPase-associated factor 1 [Leucoagaricus sp. SymC.cos]|nr:Proteasomal ATPase-associated factor 1 [Leucoagaricus sp. SymC.cos]
MAYISLPVVTVQRDFCDVIRDVDEGIAPVDKFWVSCYKSGETSVHAKVEVELDEVKRDLVRFRAKDGDVEFSEMESGYNVGCKPLDIPPTPVVLSVQDYNDSERTNPLRPQRISAFDVAPDATRFATGHLDGSVIVYPSTALSSPEPFSNAPKTQQINSSKRKLVSKPHVSNVTSLTFFQSSRVLLSSGADFALSILSAEFPDSWSESTSGLGTRVHPVRVLRGHTRSVTSACILGLGRNIVSSSLDSTLRLWDVPSGGAFSTVYASSPVLCLCTGARMPTPPDGEDLPASGSPPPDERETPEVAHTVTYAGLQNGSFEVFDMRSKSSIYKSSSTSSVPINAISHLASQYLLATGASDGVVTIYDVRSITAPLTLFRRNEASISDIEFAPQSPSTSSIDGEGYNVGLAIATTDGLPYIASLIPEGPGVQAELIGVDCDPVRNIRVRAGSGDYRKKLEVWSASDDAIVRRYIL